MLYFGNVQDNYYRKIKRTIGSAKTYTELFETIVNAPFHNPVRTIGVDLGIIVLLLVDGANKTIDRIALSDTEQAAGAIKMSEKPFKDIKIPLEHKNNLISRAIATGQPQITTDWKDLFTPALSPSAARLNQAGAGIEVSYIYPLRTPQGGALIFSFFQEARNIGDTHCEFMENYRKLVEEYIRVFNPATSVHPGSAGRRGRAAPA